MKKNPLKASIAWCLYDWAHSAFPTVITTFVFASYFTQAIAKDSISGTSQWGNAIALAGIIIALLSPTLGAIADYGGRRKPWLLGCIIVGVISSGLLWFSKPGVNYIHWTLTCVVLGTIGLEVGSAFYNAMMRGLVSEEYLGRLSGWAWALGYVGGLLCLMIALMLVQNEVKGLNLDSSTAEPVRFCAILVAVWLALFSIPLFIWVPDQPATGISAKKAISEGLIALINSLQNLRNDKQIWLYLLAHMLYVDALNTLFTFGGIYAAGTFGLNTAEIILFGILMNVSAGLGAFAFAWVDDYFGSKPTILISLFFMILLLTGLLFVRDRIWFWTLSCSLCLFVGPVQAASRSLMARISPPSHMTELFGFYALSGKATAFIGPWLVGLFTVGFQSQRAGMSTLLIFLVAGSLVLWFVKPQSIHHI